ncbi:MAG: type II toxin-antitoxin system VapC family toxin [Pseudohongiellaceae bacterium]
MILYLDPSAYIKNYIREPEHKVVAKLMGAAEIVAIHELGLVEVSSAFERAYRERRISAEQLRRVHLQLNEDWASTLVLSTDKRLLRDAVRLLQQYPLKAYDAVHVAAALALCEESDVEIVFAGFDKQQNRAAEMAGLKLPGGWRH